MPSSNQIARITAAMGDPVRVNMLLAMRFDGGLTASELALVGNVAPSTASEHLAKMADANLIVQQKAGRRRLYSLADAEVCDLLDLVTARADRARSDAAPDATLPEGLLHARLCYDHLAGRMGCAVTAAMFHEGILAHGRRGPTVTRSGAEWFGDLGIDPETFQDRPRCALRLCRDWTEDAHHLGGGIASALLDVFRRRDWVRTHRGDMQVFLTPRGITGFREFLGLDFRRPPA
ncbi:MAG: winged helix-turn-helix domain-containing protein [Roseovarius confluentis]|uniref:ArsR/SmtB family transcription factor n=1 Tax=Roseovarius sp. TaxID=1486281 RepID=UPI0032EC826F